MYCCFGIREMGQRYLIRMRSLIINILDYVVIAVAAWKEIMHTLLSYHIPKEKITRGRAIYHLADIKELEMWLEKRNPLLYEEINLNLPKKKIWFEDFWPVFNIYHNRFVDILKKHFCLEFDCIEPDYVIGGVFGNNSLLFDNIRILFVSENMLPDFNHYDYAYGFERIQIQDRYYRLAGKEYYNGMCVGADKNNRLYDVAARKHECVDVEEFLKRDFCCRVVSNDLCSVREEFFERLNAKCFVASGGKAKNNLQPQKPVEDKHSFLQGYQFDIAMENSLSPGCYSEKMIESWAAGCIPIYWGNPNIGLDFNEEAFVNGHKFSSLDEPVEYVLELAQDKERMEKMLKAPIKNTQEENDETLETFFLKIMSQPIEKAYRSCSFFSCFEGEENGMEKRYSPDECMRITQAKED